MAVGGLVHNLTAALLDSARRQGIDTAALTGGRLPGEDEFWRGRDLIHVMEAIAEEMQDEFWGLAPKSCPVGTFRQEIERIVEARTLAEALELGCEFFRSRTEGLIFTLRHDDHGASIDVLVNGPPPPDCDLLIEWQIARWYMLSQWLIGEEIPLDRVDFAHSMRASPVEYRKVFGEHCQFLQPCSRPVFPSEYLRRPVVDRRSSLKHEWNTQPVDIRPATAPRRVCHDMLKAAIKTRLKTMAPMPTMVELAEQFDVCSQTLRRRLRSERSSYRILKAEARREVVLDCIRDDRLSLGQVSLLAGFAETNGLVRAMKSWTGLTPSEYRRSAAMPETRAADRLPLIRSLVDA